MNSNSLLKLAVLAGLSTLAGCATLPTNGPTGHQIEASTNASVESLPIQLIHVETINEVPPGQPIAALDASFAAPPFTLPADVVGPGDALDINIYEAGVALFSSSGPNGSSSISPVTGVQVQRLPPIRVDDAGFISLPYVGRLNVNGHTVREVQAMVKAGLQGYSQNPQVLITMSETIANTVIVGGEVAKPGRLVLSTNRESLSDVVALAGGYRGASKDLLARILRNGRSTDIRLNDIVQDPSLDAQIVPGDRVTLINDPRTFSVLGASGAVAQLPFNRSAVSLAEAIAMAGGVNANIGNPAAVFLFRYEPDEQGKAIPKVYHLNMMKAGTYFLAQRFAMRDKDVIYIGNAAANQPGKLLQLISQLFTPLVTVTAAVQTLK
jgi:polysaccharide export outer membrane protein